MKIFTRQKSRVKIGLLFSLLLFSFASCDKGSIDCSTIYCPSGYVCNESTGTCEEKEPYGPVLKDYPAGYLNYLFKDKNFEFIGVSFNFNGSGVFIFKFFNNLLLKELLNLRIEVSKPFDLFLDDKNSVNILSFDDNEINLITVGEKTNTKTTFKTSVKKLIEIDSTYLEDSEIYTVGVTGNNFLVGLDISDGSVEIENISDKGTYFFPQIVNFNGKLLIFAYDGAEESIVMFSKSTEGWKRIVLIKEVPFCEEKFFKADVTDEGVLYVFHYHKLLNSVNLYKKTSLNESSTVIDTGESSDEEAKKKISPPLNLKIYSNTLFLSYYRDGSLKIYSYNPEKDKVLAYKIQNGIIDADFVIDGGNIVVFGGEFKKISGLYSLIPFVQSIKR